MKRHYIYKFIFTSLSFLLLGSCQAIDDVADNSIIGEGKFLVTPPSQYTVEMSRSVATSPKVWTSDCNDITANVTEEAWNTTKDLNTRSTVTGEEVEWNRSNPDLSLYATDTNNNLAIYDVPINPYTHEVYDKYEISTSISKGNIVGTIDNSSFLWNSENLKGHLISANIPETMDFYGYYPRPRDVRTDNLSYIYIKNSIIDVDDARKKDQNWNILSYSFSDNQNEDNQDYFDIMCSIPEKGNKDVNNRYGNKEKKQSDNIQMAFEHVFCLLNITINKSDDYNNSCEITDLSVSGSQIFKSGTLNILTGETTPKDGGSVLNREFNAQCITSSSPFHTTLIAQPSNDTPTASSKERIMINCTIDGTKYVCDLTNLELHRGCKYNINLTVKPSGLVQMHIWNGAKVIIDNVTYNGGTEHKINVSNATQTFKVEAAENTEIKVLNNGNIISKNSDGSYPMEKDKTYNIVTYPSKEWYATNALRIQYDGLWNNKYKGLEQQNQEMAWSDLSGHDYDGSLQGFTSGNECGWTGKGLSFDGNEALLTFPGTVNDGDYTVEMYVYIPSSQKHPYPRLIAEGIKYVCYCLNSDASDDRKYRISIYGNNILDHNLANPSSVVPTNKMCQLDFKYTANPKKITVTMTYWDEQNKQIKQVSAENSQGNINNAVPVSTASLGGRNTDTKRSLVGTYYSFLMYDRALSEDEVKANFEVNKKRYGIGTTRQ